MLKLFEKKKMGRTFWYVLVGFNTTFEEDLMRLNYLRERNQTVYVQLYNFIKDPKLVLLARWANSHARFKATPFDTFVSKYKAKKIGKGLII